MPKLVCNSCGHEFVEGDEAREIVLGTIRTLGDTVYFRERKVLVCEGECSDRDS